MNGVIKSILFSALVLVAVGSPIWLDKLNQEGKMDYIIYILQIIGIFAQSIFTVILLWIALFGGKVSIKLNNPLDQIKKLFSKKKRTRYY